MYKKKIDRLNHYLLVAGITVLGISKLETAIAIFTND
jgi:hypothetical protein